MPEMVPNERVNFLATWEGSETASFAEIVALAKEVKRDRKFISEKLKENANV